jgi:uncharacterized protein YndB with AHSA1/START domain
MEQSTLISEKRTVHFTRLINLPLNKVWDAWTKPEIMKKWWGPKNFTCPYFSIDFREGGKYLGCMRSAEGVEYWSTGFYKEIVHHQKIVCTDSFSDEKGNIISASELDMPGDWPLELIVTVLFEEVEGKTQLTVDQVGIPTAMIDECIVGWQQSLDKFEEID